MQIDDPPTCESPAGRGGQDSHVSGGDYVIDFVFVEQFDHAVVVRVALVITNRLPIDVKLFRNILAGIPVANHHDWFG
jgi:hypothetical protein